MTDGLFLRAVATLETPLTSAIEDVRRGSNEMGYSLAVGVGALGKCGHMARRVRALLRVRVSSVALCRRLRRR